MVDSLSPFLYLKNWQVARAITFIQYQANDAEGFEGAGGGGASAGVKNFGGLSGCVWLAVLEDESMTWSS